MRLKSEGEGNNASALFIGSDWKEGTSLGAQYVRTGSSLVLLLAPPHCSPSRLNPKIETRRNFSLSGEKQLAVSRPPSRFPYAMDPAALALGVLPLLGGAVQGLQAYRTTQRKFKVFRHASREVSRLRKHLERQQQFFANECHLLLRSVLSDEDGIHRMLDDQDLPEWQSSSLELSLSAHLMKNQSVCQDILTEISAVIEELQKELSSFDELVLDRLEVSIHSTETWRLGTPVTDRETRANPFEMSSGAIANQ